MQNTFLALQCICIFAHFLFTVTNYTLYYFPVRGRGEPIRYLFCDNRIPYTEVNVITPDNSAWQTKYKPMTPFGQVPLLKDGDFELAQSNAILRYLGGKHGLVGDTPEELALADMVNDSVEDLRVPYTRMIYQNYEAGKEPFIADLPNKLQPFEKFLTKWDKPFILGKITFVDYNFFDLLDDLVILAPKCLEEFPALTKYYNNILQRPGIADHRSKEEFKTRPVNGNGKQ